MHYTTSGKATHDVTRVGLYFREGAAEVRVQDRGAREPDDCRFRPNTKAHTESIAATVPAAKCSSTV